ncbi:uncharacterized protein LOC121995309 [Zingiber officinale]|uniref:uncharacterized protein LOC121995309 n=1 Tax=Zingiber officinale TaxID=94328 RepID=UPI001C4B35FB|nr:uncharacterized protein LOC121995309 [Zingiber officinale]
MAAKIMKKSVNTFLCSYQTFTSIAGLFVFPASLSILLSQAFLSCSNPILHRIVYSHLCFLFRAARFPDVGLYSWINLKLAQTIFSFIFTLPFTLTFLLLAKVLIIRTTNGQPCWRRCLFSPQMPSCRRSYCSALITHLFSSSVMVVLNAAVFSALCLVFSAAEIAGLTSNTWALLLTATGLMLSAVAIGNAIAVCKLSIVVATTEGRSGWEALVKACVLAKGRAETALALVMAPDMGMALAEALFQYKVVRPYLDGGGKVNGEMVWEAYLIAYVHSLLLVLDAITSCLFYNHCKFRRRLDSEDGVDDHYIELEPEEKRVCSFKFDM